MRKLMSREKNARILLIDDDPTSNLLVESILRNHGFNRIKSIDDPRLAVDTYLEYEPDLILLDIEMPGMDGFEVFQCLQIAEKRNVPPVIILTVRNDHKSKERAMELGIQYFLEKPFHVNELLIRVQNILHINRLHRQSAQKNQFAAQKAELESGIVESLLASIRFRDQETGAHVNRMSAVVLVLSEGMGLPREQASRLAVASKLHDVGKIGIPDNILLKPARLTREEREVMKKHTLIGDRILSTSGADILRLAGSIARTHHEDWDGNGYPLGLSGKLIPMAGRVTALADVFDALVSDRPYKDAWDFDRAVRYVQEESGRKFDPDVVRVFVENIDEIHYIYETITDSDGLSVHSTEV